MSVQKKLIVKNLIKEEIINIVVQVNGKKRSIIQTEPNTQENTILNLIKSDENMKKYFDGKKIKKHIYIKNKLINILI